MAQECARRPSGCQLATQPVVGVAHWGTPVLFLLIMIGVMATYGAVRMQQRERLALPAASFGSLSDGKRAFLVGRITPVGEPLRAPLSGRPAIYYRISIDEVSTRASPLCIHHNRFADFALSDGQGQTVLVKASGTSHGPQFELVSAVSGMGVPQLHLMPTDRRIRGVLEAQGLDAKELERRRVTFRCSEVSLEPGACVGVKGLLREELSADGTGGGYRGSSTRLVLQSPRRGRMLVTNNPERVRTVQATSTA